MEKEWKGGGMAGRANAALLGSRPELFEETAVTGRSVTCSSERGRRTPTAGMYGGAHRSCDDAPGVRRRVVDILHVNWHAVRPWGAHGGRALDSSRGRQCRLSLEEVGEQGEFVHGDR